MLLIFLDTETTGLDPEKHRTIEIAFRLIDSRTGHPLSRYESIISQTAAVWAEADQESLKVNGFTWEELLKGKTEKAVATEIIEELNQAGIQEKSGVFICQNPSFDKAFFSQLIGVTHQKNYGWPYHWLDLASMYWAFRQYKDKTGLKEIQERGLSKDKIAAYLGLPVEVHPHRAMNGVNHLIACYNCMFPNSFDLTIEKT